MIQKEHNNNTNKKHKKRKRFVKALPYGKNVPHMYLQILLYHIFAIYETDL